jgi:nucleotide-binding universal stress UspA family protein
MKRILVPTDVSEASRIAVGHEEPLPHQTSPPAITLCIRDPSRVQQVRNGVI